MPANLTPQYLEAEERYREGKTDEEKLAALEDMYALLPKHKGTDKIQADIRRRISRIKKKSESRSKSSRETPYKVVREGAGQVLLIGPPNSGKSTLASALSGVSLKAAPYPFTTRAPRVAMMPYLKVQIQLVDLPPITADFCAYWQVNLCRTADLILVVIDLSRKDVLESFEELVSTLRKRRIELGTPDGEDDSGVVRPKAILIGNKGDRELARQNLQILPELLPSLLPLYPFSALKSPPEDLEKLRSAIWEKLDLIRVFSKPPKENADLETPFTLSRGDNVMDFATAVHKDFAENFQSARVWGSGKFPGQIVSREHVLRDGDIVELHMRD